MASRASAVYDLTGDRPTPVGTTTVLIDHHVRTGEFIIQLGENAKRSKGIGTEATSLTLDYAFHVTNLGCMYLSVLAPSTAAIRAPAAMLREGPVVRSFRGEEE